MRRNGAFKISSGVSKVVESLHFAAGGVNPAALSPGKACDKFQLKSGEDRRMVLTLIR
jgi:hypothetical protein